MLSAGVPHHRNPGAGGFVTLLALAVWALWSSPVAGEWIRLPEPDLTGLEHSIVDQLSSYREIAAGRVSDESVGPDEVAVAVGELGRHYHAYGLAAPAEECYRIAGRLTPGEFRWHYLLGYLLQGLNRLDDAEEAYLRALELYRAAPPALLRLAEVYVELDRLEAAASLMREALALDPSSAAAEASLGELYQRMGRNEEAIELLLSALDEVPDANRLFYPLALAYRATGQTDEARQLMAARGKVGIRPADPLIDGLDDLRTGERVHLLSGQTAFRAGRYPEAVEEFTKAVDAAPDSVNARVDLGSALGEAGRIDEAIEQYEKALEIAPGNVTALFNLGVLQARRGELAAAVSHLRQAAQLEPGDVGLRLELAEAHRRNGELDDALVHFRAAAELAPPGEDARVGAARVFVAQDRFAEARDTLEEGLRLLPTSGLMAHALSRLLAMGPDLEVRDGERALELAMPVFEARPTAEHAEVVAEALAESERCSEAAQWARDYLDSLAGEMSGEDAARFAGMVSRYETGPPCRLPGISR